MTVKTAYNPWAVLVAAFVLMVPVAAWQAHVVCVIWGWFVTTQFGVAVPPLWITAGLLLMVRIPLTGFKTEANEGDTADRIIYMVMYGFLGPLFALAAAWVIASLAGVA